MKTLKKNLFIPFVLGIMLSVIIACNDESGSGTALTLSSYEGKVKIGDMASVQISLSDPESFSKYNPQIQISAESETKRSIFREKDKTKRSKKESAQHSKSRNKSFVMTSVSAL